MGSDYFLWAGGDQVISITRQGRAVRSHPTTKLRRAQTAFTETAKTCQSRQKRANPGPPIPAEPRSTVKQEQLMSATSQVEFSLRAGTGEIRLNRPEELNALTLEMIEAIDGQLAAWAGDPKVTGIVLGKAGSGDAFCAGIDQRALYHALLAGDREYG